MRINSLSFALVIALVGVVANLGCGDDAADKNLFSSWSDTESGFVLDLTSGEFGTFSMTWVITGGAQCESTIVMGGTQTEGSAVVTESTYVADTGSGTDPGCSTLDESYTFTKTATTLTVCDAPSSCSEYI